MKHTYRIWLLMNKKLSLSITPAEEEELTILLMSDPELWYSYEILQAVMSLDNVPEEFIKEIKLLLEDQHTEPEKLNHFLQETLERAEHNVMPISSTRSKKSRYLTIAAVCAFFVLIAGIFIIKQKVTTEKALVAMNEIVAPKGSKTEITLADGTSIWLNAGSKLIYPKNFSWDNREVYLTGEAYFKVIHNSKHLFVVHTPESDITDLGTVFNVKAYAGSLTTETTLIEGSVQVTLKNNPAMKIMMKPKQKLVLHHNQDITSGSNATLKEQTSEPVFEVFKIIPYPQTNDIVETAWVHDKLIFRDQRFSELAKEMERRYNVTISIKDESIQAYQLSGIFTTENIEQALYILQQIAPFKFKINNDRILITK